MAKRITLIFIFFLSFISLYSQKETTKDTIHRSLGGLILKVNPRQLWHVYDPERGFFQKAYTDKGDPRFMITNEDESFKFGIGGFISVVGITDFNGMVENRDFVTSQIPVPSENYSGQFALGAESSRINFKAVGSSKFGNIVAFLETDFRGNTNTLRLRHAYISYFGFTIGQTWSTFMDLEAAPPTIDLEGPNTEISVRQPMIRYTHSFLDKFSVSVAMEMSSALIGDYSEFGIRNEYQKVPDFPIHFKYKDNFGHLQLGGLVRVMNYYDDTVAHRSINKVGFGVSLSGKFNIGKKNFLYFQSVYGQGIARYIQDLSFANLDLVRDLNRSGNLRTLPMFGAYLSFQRNWMEHLYSALIYGFTMLNPPPQYNFPWLFSHTHYFAVNLFWEFIPYGTMGIEYLFGKRVNQTGTSGNANRIDIMFRYGF